MDFNKEKEGLQESKDWWKPLMGQHKVKFLSNGEEEEPHEWEGRMITQVRYDIELNGKLLNWGVTKRPTRGSLYGQIILIGANSGTLINQEVNVIVKGSGKETSYTILEALPLMGIKEETIK